MLRVKEASVFDEQKDVIQIAIHDLQVVQEMYEKMALINRDSPIDKNSLLRIDRDIDSVAHKCLQLSNECESLLDSLTE